MKIVKVFFLASALLISSVGALAADKVTMMFPAAPELPNVSAFQIAKYQHYYSNADLDVEFLPGKGGVDAGRQVGTGKADFAEVFGDTAIILRSGGLPVRMVALMGGRGPMALATRSGSGIKDFEDLKGKSISILGYEDSTYYVLLAALASVNLSKEDVSIQALEPSGVVKEFINGNVQVCACIPEWFVAAEDAGVKMDLIPVSEYVPALGPSIVTSDRFLADHPDVVRRFVQATLKAFVELRNNSDESAKVYAQAVPVHQGHDAMLGRVYRYYYSSAWSDQNRAGFIDPRRLKDLQDIYYERRIIDMKSSITDLYTNRFI
jgi:NitT/TauT family transport system substrate-binding protein